MKTENYHITTVELSQLQRLDTTAKTGPQTIYKFLMSSQRMMSTIIVAVMAINHSVHGATPPNLQFYGNIVHVQSETQVGLHNQNRIDIQDHI